MRLRFLEKKIERKRLDDETEIWRLRREVKVLRERERARMVVVDTLSGELERVRRAWEECQREDNALQERARLLEENNKELRRRYDTARAALVRSGKEVKELRLMKESLEARIGEMCVESGEWSVE